MTLTPEQALELLKQLENSRCEEFHLDLGDTSLSLRRAVSSDQAPLAPRKPAPRPAAVDQPPPVPAEPAPKPRKTSAGGAAAPQPGQREITAPMGGSFYRRPAPDEPPFVEEGSLVREGDPICVIEVMKLFSTVYADCDGRIVAIHVEDAATIEQNQPLFTVEPTAG